jgi:acetylornithine deacetylase/succinyl-diaminopimelate desuccinylase-like protein
VADQDPDEILDRIEAHLHRHAPTGARVSMVRYGVKARAYRVPTGHPGVEAVAEVLAEHYGRPPYHVRIGGSLPITDMFFRELNAHTIMLGFGQDDERGHSPNEFFRLSDFERGQEIYALVLERLGTMEPGALGVGDRS